MGTVRFHGNLDLNNNMVIDNLIRDNLFLKDTCSKLNSLMQNFKIRNEEQQSLIEA